MLFKRNTMFSIILLLSCIFISLLLSNIPFIVHYINRIEGMTQKKLESEKITNEELDDLQISINGISDNIVNMNNLIQSNLKLSDDDAIDTFNKNIKKYINLINTGIDNIDISDIQSDLSDIMKKNIPKEKEKDKEKDKDKEKEKDKDKEKEKEKKILPEDYQDLVDKMKKEIKSINDRISEKKDLISKQAVSKADDSVSQSKEASENTSSKNPLNKTKK